MTDPSFTPAGERQLLAVYPTGEAAQDPRERLVHSGVAASSIDLDMKADEIASLEAEMHEELTEGSMLPTAAKGMGLVGGVAIFGCLVVALPLAFIDFGGTLAWRLVWFSAIAVAVGGTIGFVAGAAAAVKRPGELGAAHRGVVLRVQEDSPAIRAALIDARPLRLDGITQDGTPIETLMTEDDVDDTGAVDNMAANAGGDDYHPQSHPERAVDNE